MDIESIVLTGGLTIFFVFFVSVGGVVIYGLTHGRPNDQGDDSLSDFDKYSRPDVIPSVVGNDDYYTNPVYSSVPSNIYYKDTKMTLNTEKILTVLAFPAVAVTSYGYMYDWGVRKICVIWLCIVLFVALYVGGGYLGIALAKLTKATQRNGR